MPSRIGLQRPETGHHRIPLRFRACAAFPGMESLGDAHTLAGQQPSHLLQTSWAG
jgi:hypothetical protein